MSLYNKLANPKQPKYDYYSPYENESYTFFHKKAVILQNILKEKHIPAKAEKVGLFWALKIKSSDNSKVQKIIDNYERLSTYEHMKLKEHYYDKNKLKEVV